jgi:hypothetical protein
LTVCDFLPVRTITVRPATSVLKPDDVMLTDEVLHLQHRGATQRQPYLSWGQLSAHLSAVGFRLAQHDFRAFSGCLFPCPVTRESGAGLRRKPRLGNQGGTGPGAGLPASDRAWRRPHATGCPARPGGNMPLALR